MFNKLKIRTKLLVVFIIIGIVPLGVVTVLALSNASTALHDEVWPNFLLFRRSKGTILKAISKIYAPP